MFKASTIVTQTSGVIQNSLRSSLKAGRQTGKRSRAAEDTTTRLQQNVTKVRKSNTTRPTLLTTTLSPIMVVGKGIKNKVINSQMKNNNLSSSSSFYCKQQETLTTQHKKRLSTKTKQVQLMTNKDSHNINKTKQMNKKNESIGTITTNTTSSLIQPNELNKNQMTLTTLRKKFMDDNNNIIIPHDELSSITYINSPLKTSDLKMDNDKNSFDVVASSSSGTEQLSTTTTTTTTDVIIDIDMGTEANCNDINKNQCNNKNFIQQQYNLLEKEENSKQILSNLIYTCHDLQQQKMSLNPDPHTIKVCSSTETKTEYSSSSKSYTNIIIGTAITTAATLKDFHNNNTSIKNKRDSSIMQDDDDDNNNNNFSEEQNNNKELTLSSTALLACDKKILYNQQSHFKTSIMCDSAAYGHHWLLHHKQREHLYQPWQLTLTGKLEKLRLGVMAMYWESAKLHSVTPATIHLAISNFNRLLASWTNEELEHPLASRWALTAVIAYRLAFKMEERPEILWEVSNFWDIFPMFMDWTIDRSDTNMNKVEMDAIHILGNSMDIPLAPMFLSLYLSAGGWPEDALKDYRDLALYILGLVTFTSSKDHLLKNIVPSKMAVAALVLAIKIVNGDRATSAGILPHLFSCPKKKLLLPLVPPKLLSSSTTTTPILEEQYQNSTGALCMCRYEFFPDRLKAYCNMELTEIQPVIRGLSCLLRSKPEETHVLKHFFPVWGEHDWQ